MNFRRLCGVVFGLMLAASAVALRMPVMTSTVRGILVATLALGVFTGLVYLVKYVPFRPAVLYPVIFLLGMFLVWVVLASKPPDVDMLQQRYISRLNRFQGVDYRWGGETALGMDCSGLARVALWQAMLHEGAKEVNPRLLGSMLWKFWWRDISARDMLAGKYGYTRPIGQADRLAGYDTSDLQPGDLAVADSGAHVLVYVGDGRWIEASPDDQKVVVNTAPANSKRGWFNVRVTLMRWWILED